VVELYRQCQPNNWKNSCPSATLWSAVNNKYLVVWIGPKSPRRDASDQYSVELGYNIIEGSEWIVSLYTSIAQSELLVMSEEKIFQGKIQACR
jgi:hypothetical protein